MVFLAIFQKKQQGKEGQGLGTIPISGQNALGVKLWECSGDSRSSSRSSESNRNAKSQRTAKGAGGKGPRQKTSKNAKNRQKYFRHFSTFFAQGKKKVKNRQKVSKYFSTIFARHQFSGPFWGALKIPARRSMSLREKGGKRERPGAPPSPTKPSHEAVFQQLLQTASEKSRQIF